MGILAHATGLRQSELLGVRRTDLDAGTLRFTTRYGRDGILREPKTAAGLRLLPLPQPPWTSCAPIAKRQDRERTTAVQWVGRGLMA
jgi:integrase